MKPTTFLSIIGISGLFLISYFQFNFNKIENETEIKVAEIPENYSVDITNQDEKKEISVKPIPTMKISDSTKNKRFKKPKKESKKFEPQVTRDPDSRKDFANVFWKKSYTLFDLVTDEPIFPIIENGQKIYKIYYSSNEDPNPYSGSFTEEQLERHLFYKFKDLASCQKFCDSKK
jgi:hypothetical protein